MADVNNMQNISDQAVTDANALMTDPAQFKQDRPTEFFGIIFFLLLDAMQIRQDTILTQSKQLSANAEAQNRLNKKDGDIKFAILEDPENASQADIEKNQNLNSQLSATKDSIRDQLITSRQVAQVLMTQTSTNVNFLQQDSSEDSEWLKTLNAIFGVINEINQPQQ